MRCLNCHYEEIPPNTEHCPRCKIHLPSLLRDVLIPGTLLRSDTYRLDYALGRGSFGITYAARHNTLNEVFAIKEFYPIEFALRNQTNQAVIVPAQAAHSYQRALHRFIEEARILAKLNHPNVVRVYDMFEGNDTAYMVMDLIEGKTLTQILKAQPGRKLPLPKVESLVEQIVEALSAIHQAGIYHLDIKPENLIVTPDNKICLIDFGAARQVVHARKMDTRLFTEQYAAPEIMTGGELGPESDLFELGMMVYQLLTGKLPPTAMKRLSEEVDWYPDGLIPPWDRLITNALHLKRDDRPGTVREWWLGRAKFSGQHNPNHQNQEGAAGLRGKFIQPDLFQDKMQQRLGRGVLRKVIALSPSLVVAIAASGGALFDLSTGQLLWEIDTPVCCGTLTPDHALLVLTYRRWVYVWDLQKGKLLQQFRGHEQNITSLAVSNNSYGVFSSGKSSMVSAWDLRTGQEYKPFQQINHFVTQIAISRQGDYLAIGTQEGEVCFWDMEKHQEISCLQGHSQSITSLVFSPNQEILATGSRDNTIQLWSIPSGQHLKRLKGHLDWVTSLVFSSDNRLLASTAGIDDKSIRLWDLAQSKEVKRLQGHWNRIQSLDFSPNNRHLISGGYDYTIRSWNLEFGVESTHLKRHSNWVYGLACSP
ncbi:MAG: protein kinase domain-containing protein, partial [Microcystaceae cyanobacterium]